MVTAFEDHVGLYLVDCLDCGETLTAECLVVHLECYSMPFIAKGLDCWAKAL